MTVLRPPHPAPDPADGGFGFDDLIYSRSDPRGRILSGNSSFRRIAGLPWPDLIGAPHRVIRHPDMPQGFFHLFWQMLHAGQSAVGYMKNRRPDGGHVWALTIAMPCAGGFFALRLRPATALFDTIRDVYAAQRLAEQTGAMTPAQAGQALLDRLCDQGFASYDAFAAQALAAEIRARDAALQRPPDREAAALTALLVVLDDTLAEQARLVARFSDLVLLPVNMRLAAGRLEPRGGPISQIAVNYKTASEQIARRLSDFAAGPGNLCSRMADALRRCLILAAAARLQAELSADYDRMERPQDGSGRRVERGRLQAAIAVSRATASASLKDAAGLALRLNAASLELRRLILGLDTIRILARVESCKTSDSAAALTATIDRIDGVQVAVGDSLKGVMARAAAINDGLTALRAAARRQGRAG